MTSRISHTTTDCRDAYALSEWWKQVLGYTDVPGDPNAPGHQECMILGGAGEPPLLFIEVEDVDPSVKNRTHLDLRPTDRTQDEEVARLIEFGARVHNDLRGTYGPGTGWVVLLDPEDNQFCILRSDAERAASSAS